MTANAYSTQISTFNSEGLTCTGTLYLPKGKRKPPVILMAHGFAAVREFRLSDFAEHFAEAGYAAYVFDYRNFGDSEGTPRHWVDPKRHQQDWRNALRHVQSLSKIDPKRIVLWGSSYSGGHVLQVASERPDIAGVISQVPHVDGLATAMLIHPLDLIKATAAGIVDLVGSTLLNRPYYSPVVGKPGQFAAMNSAEVWDGWFAMVPPESQWENKVLSRAFLTLPLFSPTHNVRKIAVPALVIAGETDTVTPASAARKAAAKIPGVEFHMLPCNHFQPYVGDFFEKNLALQLDFLKRLFARK